MTNRSLRITAAIAIAGLVGIAAASDEFSNGRASATDAAPGQAGQPIPRGPCPGGESGRADLGIQTGNIFHTGIQYVPGADFYWGSARDAVGNRVYKFDNMGNLLAGQGFTQIAGANTDLWGYRDMASDGTFLYGGWAGGVARHNINDGSGGVLHIAGAAPGGVGTWRALAYDPTGDSGNGSFWTASFGSALVEVRAVNGALLNTFPNLDGWSLYGLAYDPFTGNLWGYSSPNQGDIVEIDTTTGRETGLRYTPGCIPGTGGPTGLCQIQGGLTAVPGGAFGSTLSTWDLVSLGQATSDSIVGTMIYCGAPGLTGACCLPMPNKMCVDGETAFSCNLLGGAYQGDGSQCGALTDWDGDGIPDECDDDDDNDGVLDVDDACPMNTPGLLIDIEGRPRMDLNDDCAVDGLDIPIAVDQLVSQ